MINTHTVQGDFGSKRIRRSFQPTWTILDLPVYSKKFLAVALLLQDARTRNPVHKYLDKAEITMKSK